MEEEEKEPMEFETKTQPHRIKYFNFPTLLSFSSSCLPMPPQQFLVFPSCHQVSNALPLPNITISESLPLPVSPSLVSSSCPLFLPNISLSLSSFLCEYISSSQSLLLVSPPLDAPSSCSPLIVSNPTNLRPY